MPLEGNPLQIECSCQCTCGPHYEREVSKRHELITSLDQQIAKLKSDLCRLRKQHNELLRNAQRYELALNKDETKIDNLVAGRAYSHYLVLNRFQMGSRMKMVPAGSHEDILTRYQFDCLRRAEPVVDRPNLNNLPYRRKGQLLFAKDCVGLIKCVVYSPPSAVDGVLTSNFKPVLLCLLQKDHVEVCLSKLEQHLQQKIREALKISCYRKEKNSGVADVLHTEFDQEERQILDNIEVGIKCIIRLWDKQVTPTTPTDWILRVEYCPDVVNFFELPLDTQRVIYARHGTKFFNNWLHVSAFQTSKYNCTYEDPVLFYRPFDLVDFLNQRCTYEDLTHISSDFIFGTSKDYKPFFRELLTAQNKVVRWLHNDDLPAFAFRPVCDQSIVPQGVVYHGTAAYQYVAAQMYGCNQTPFEICLSRDILSPRLLRRAQSVIISFAFNSVPKSCPSINIADLYVPPVTYGSLSGPSSAVVMGVSEVVVPVTSVDVPSFVTTFGPSSQKFGLDLPEEHRCRFCPLICLPFSTARMLKQHKMLTHERALVRQCPRCPKYFWVGKSAWWHQVLVHKDGRKEWRYCVICRLSYRNLDRHVHAMHAKNLLSRKETWMAASVL